MTVLRSSLRLRNSYIMISGERKRDKTQALLTGIKYFSCPSCNIRFIMRSESTSECLFSNRCASVSSSSSASFDSKNSSVILLPSIYFRSVALRLSHSEWSTPRPSLYMGAQVEFPDASDLVKERYGIRSRTWSSSCLVLGLIRTSRYEVRE